MTRMLILVIFLTMATSLQALDHTAPINLLGLKTADLFKDDEHPVEVFPFRGAKAEEDSVVFYYDGGFYLFIYGNRVWQVRYDSNCKSIPFGLKAGEEKAEILSSFKKKEQSPVATGKDYVTFQLRDLPWPVRLRMYFSEGKLSDVYVYRADF